MKKIIALLVLSAMLLSLAACSGKAEEEDTPVIDDGAAAGGWTVNADAEGSIPDDVKASFDAALEDMDGAKLEPIALLGTQVVAGTNSLILCKSTPVTPTAGAKWVLARLYAGVDGTNEIKTADFNFASYRDAESEGVEKETLCGGWNVAEEIAEAKLDERAQAAFDGVTAGLMGAKMEPIALLGTQVVAGTNFAFLAKATTPSADAASNLCVLFVYADLEGNYELLNVADINLTEIEF